MPATSLYSAVRRFLGVLLCVALYFSVLCVAPCSAWADEGETKTVRVGWLVNNQGFQSEIGRASCRERVLEGV